MEWVSQKVVFWTSDRRLLRKLSSWKVDLDFSTGKLEPIFMSWLGVLGIGPLRRVISSSWERNLLVSWRRPFGARFSWWADSRFLGSHHHGVLSLAFWKTDFVETDCGKQNCSLKISNSHAGNSLVRCVASGAYEVWSRFHKHQFLGRASFWKSWVYMQCVWWLPIFLRYKHQDEDFQSSFVLQILRHLSANFMGHIFFATTQWTARNLKVATPSFWTYDLKFMKLPWNLGKFPNKYQKFSQKHGFFFDVSATSHEERGTLFRVRRTSQELRQTSQELRRSFQKVFSEYSENFLEGSSRLLWKLPWRYVN